MLLLAPAVVSAPPSRPAAPARAAAPPAAPADTPEDREYLQLLERLSALSDFIGRNAESPQAWRSQLQQGEVALQLAARGNAKERDTWLRLAVDSHYGAAVQSPENDRTAAQRLAQLPALIAAAYPGNPVVAYAALQEIQADYVQALVKAPDNPAAAQAYLCERWLQFAQEYPATPEAPKAVMDAAQMNESLGKIEEARRCYRLLIARFTDRPQGRKAEGALWRLGRGSEPVSLQLPLLYPADERQSPAFDLGQLRGKLVVVYFWVGGPRADADFQTLKQLTDRWQDHGLEVVYVNLDADANQARAFLSGRLTAGVHLYQGGGMESAVAERYGLQGLPQAFLVGPDGALLRHSLQAAQLEAAVAARLRRDR